MSLSLNVLKYNIKIHQNTVTVYTLDTKGNIKIRTTSGNWEWNVIVEFLVNVLLFNLWLLIWLMFGY